MAEFFRFLVESNLTTAAFVIGAFAFIIAIIGRVKTIIEPSPAMRLVLALFGLLLMGMSVGSYFIQGSPGSEGAPVRQLQQPATAIATQELSLPTPLSGQVTQQPFVVLPTKSPTRITPTVLTSAGSSARPSGVTPPQAASGYVPKTPEEAAALFGGPPASAWKPCPSEPTGCWTFSLPGTSFRISVPEYCLRPDGSIDGWRHPSGYPGPPDEIQGTVRIWYNLQGATIRCH